MLRLITRLNIGGPAIQALMLTRDLQERFPTVLAAGRSPVVEGEMGDPVVAVEHVPFLRAVRPMADFTAYRSVRALIGRTQPAIVHTHMAKAGTIGRFAAKRVQPRPKIVHTFHGHVLKGYFGPVKRNAFIEIERSIAAGTDALIAVSPEVRDDLLDLGIGRPDQWRVIPLGFDLSPFSSLSGPSGVLRDRLGLSADTPLVGVLGRLARVKDHLLLFEAVAQLPDVHLAVLGDGEEAHALQVRAVASDLAGRVHFMGWRRDVPAILADLDVVALTSVNEGTPVTLIEALAAAVPVVATDVGGVRSVVDDEVDGLLVKERTAEAVGLALERLLGDATAREAMGARGRKLMLERFNKERLLQEISELYEELLAD